MAGGKPAGEESSQTEPSREWMVSEQLTTSLESSSDVLGRRREDVDQVLVLEVAVLVAPDTGDVPLWGG
jgi:hypothetical protein